ncbi:dihydrofolate reductase family protein [Arthrobacter sp. H5]|uniref:dihydrofolate reductase family protein n=1 Tax=Arthrobacter sp. H5 TaxID=1267973 RepID=UPI001C1E22E8|nr:dihydrofolate reductase family protein [Arthrobacter sp. H5]
MASVYVTLDGVMEDPTWTQPYLTDAAQAHARELLFASDALLLGRRTYQGFASTWPGQTDEQGFAHRMNSMPKYVVSSTLTDTSWNAELVSGDITAAVSLLKESSDRTFLMYGSGELVNTLFRADLIDEYQLWTAPVVHGTGKRLFEEGHAPGVLKSLGAKPLGGAVILSYGRAAA